MRKLIIITILSIELIVCPKMFGQKRVQTVTPCLKPFYHGVASGDPLSDRVIIWTRVTPDTNQINPISVSWIIAEDTTMLNPANSGVVITDMNSDFTVKIDAMGLQPNTFYFYQFKANGYKSVIGRTKTAPVGDVDSLRFAIVSCANFESGFFNAYKSLTERNDFDAIIGLGDYIYEYESGGYDANSAANRTCVPTNEIVALMDYRARYSSYRLDDDLRNLHQQFPYIIIWDDHEFSNNAWKDSAKNHQPNEGLWCLRKQYAKQAFFEWLPIRLIDTLNPYEVFRDIRFGNLAEFIMLDTRIHGRDEQSGTTGSVVNDSARQLLGTDQFTWLGNRLDSSTAQWNILAQQVMMAPLKVLGVPVNGDQWDGYPAERNRLFNHILSNNNNNIVVLTGDIHSSWANDLPSNSYNSSTGAGSVGIEFVVPSVNALAGAEHVPLGASAMKAQNPHIKYAELTKHGYVILDINKNRTQADWFYVNTIDSSSSATTFGASFYSNNLTRCLQPEGTEAIPRNSVIKFQTAICPDNTPSNVSDATNGGVFLGVYPNPVQAQLFVNYFIPKKGNVNVKLYDMNGKLVQLFNEGIKEKGVYQSLFNIESLQSQLYILEINSFGKSVRTKIIKK